jgi:hypothetical protein
MRNNTVIYLLCAHHLGADEKIIWKAYRSVENLKAARVVLQQLNPNTTYSIETVILED